jgi:hypothetical protein
MTKLKSQYAKIVKLENKLFREMEVMQELLQKHVEVPITITQQTDGFCLIPEKDEGDYSQNLFIGDLIQAIKENDGYVSSEEIYDMTF